MTYHGTPDKGTPDKGTRVTCEDSDGHQETQVIVDDYCLVTDGRMEVASMQFYANGTVQITLKKRANDA